MLLQAWNATLISSVGLMLLQAWNTTGIFSVLYAAAGYGV